MMNDLLDKTWKDYTDAMLNDLADVEAKYKTYANVLEMFLRELERLTDKVVDYVEHNS